MAKNTAIPAARVALMFSLTALLGACSWGKAPSQLIAQAPAPAAATAENRFSEQPAPAPAPAPERGFTVAVDRDEVGNLSNSIIEPDAPTKYTVVEGDTLWDISDQFLKEAWQWPQLWNYNPQIKDPHLIFPGDTIGLEYIDGKPRLVIDRDGQRITQSGSTGSAASAGGVERLSPRIRSKSLDDAIPMISGEAIESFLVHPRVVPLKQITNSPYVVGNFDGRLISAIGHQIYVRGAIKREQPRYGVYRKSKALIDPLSKRKLGYEVQHVADAKLMNLGDPSTLILTANKMETIAGDVLMSINDDSISANYKTRLPALSGGEARVISLVNSITQSGRDQVIVLNVGNVNKIKPGDVLAIESRGKRVKDPRARFGKRGITLPNTRTGVVMVFKTFDEVSYALVMESTLPIRVNDGVTGI